MNIAEPTIQIGILTACEISFKLNDNFKFSDNQIYSGKKLAIYRKGKILFNGEFHDELNFKPTSENCSFDLRNVVIGIGFHWQRMETQRFKGALKIIIEGQKLTVVNEIKVEDYLTSVISSEMSATASDELLKAHAVISRSWLLNPILNDNRRQTRDSRNPDISVDSALSSVHIVKWYERDAHTHFDVCADDHCQRYQGITKASTQAVIEAIEATKGQVLMYNGEICDARFSKSCGGVSENFENCWAPEHYPYLTKVIDNSSMHENFATDLTIEENAEKWIRESPEAFCNTNDKKILSQVLNNYDQDTTDFYRWKVEYTQAQMAEIISRRSGYDFGEIIDFKPLKRGESGRIIELQITGTKLTVIVGKELEIRKWLSNSHLYSSAFVVDKSDIKDGVPQKFTLTGAGWGHGVGLCQIGAAVMGEQGYKYHEILQHYFQNAELTTIY